MGHPRAGSHHGSFFSPVSISALLDKYVDVFEEPKGLPPPRDCDHAISLIPEAQSFSLRPYRYSYDQKNAIEQMVGDMLQAQIVVPSQSTFASPALLVKK